eukprot:m.660372 g.660372  ORF g.660372 m.660372 type:complete len:118 (-) comp22728_c0_seq50:365-718(-)
MRSVWVRVSVLPFTPPVQLAESKRMENAAIFALLSDGSLTGWHTLSPRADDAHKVQLGGILVGITGAVSVVGHDRLWLAAVITECGITIFANKNEIAGMSIILKKLFSSPATDISDS